MPTLSSPWFGRQTNTGCTWEEKEAKILRCLEGSGGPDDSINLWELRELALSAGGLLDPKIRKRAWPILTACHADLNSNANKNTVAPSHADLKALRRDVKRTVWDVAEHFSQQQASEHNKTFASNKRDTRRVCFALDETIEEEVEEVPDILPSSTMESDTPNSPSAKTISFDLDLSMTSALNSSLVSQDSSFTSSSRRSRWRKASKHEQKIVSNVIVSVLRSEAPESSCFTDDRFHYYHGLHNLTALILLNLESPSLTSLVLGKLAVFHLRDAMRKEDQFVQNAIEITLLPLLEKVDPALYKKVFVNSEGTLSFATSWISSWFASDVGDIAVASRLLDVFLVSHPTMPVYFAVALLLHHRSKILSCHPNTKTVDATIRSLGLMATLTAENRKEAGRDHAMEQAETTITAAIQLMEKFPPASLLGMAGQSACSESLSISMVQVDDTPSWFDAPSCLTEWGVLLQAKAKREGRYVDATSSRVPSFEESASFPKAAIATGKANHKRTSWPQSAVFELLLLALLVCTFVYVPRHSVELLRSPKPINFKSRELLVVSNIVANEVVTTDDQPVLALENLTALVHVVTEFPIPTVVVYELDDIELAFEQRILLPIHRSARNLLESQLLRLQVMIDCDVLYRFVDSLLRYRQEHGLVVFKNTTLLLAIAPPEQGLPKYLKWLGSKIRTEGPKVQDGARKLAMTAKQAAKQLTSRQVSAFDDRGLPRLI